ncbi:1-phosphatidylinositol phosphodiesterase [Sodiomyces alkalinus F11]|uniref:1-phosphatidylinositol phosphodiesterase n=1 Tax=Sodiomyces alkalinus (strain CBS 110278 / VKM F-3762 / F11) TaxID=1314773 RepID=A0A3N2PM25_SODAK|nr:1-phosphatidylinositol phosphodiesterase [Sodiomyces alkalinus F11]ROT35585.1 1-phosphatidylinositol phosphodiesterase [Sodiomyces alkalinus F11]
MPNLTVRNLTNLPLTLKRAERYDSKVVRTGDAFTNTITTITSFLNATNFTTTETHAEGEARSFKDVDVKIESFSVKPTEFSAPVQGKDVLRLQFECEGKRYEVDVPTATDTSTVMKRLSKGDKRELTAVYIARHDFLAILSSSDLSAWMKRLKDEYPLSLLSIPGTHNSPTCYTALPSVRCQAVGVSEQLENGVRFLDIRVSATPDNDNLALVHSAFPISLTGTKWLGDMLAEIYAFLDRNPSEAIIVSLKREGTGKASDQDMSRYLRDRFIKGNNGKDAKRWWTRGHIPTLGDVRGKIVLMRRFNVADSVRKSENDGKGFGIDASVWPDNCEDGKCGGGLVRVQDFYEIDQSTNIERKVGYSHAQLERAAEQLFRHPTPNGPDKSNGGSGSKNNNATKPPPFFVNFLSASNFFNATCWPERIAAKVNPSVVEYLCMRHGEEGKGPKKLKVGDACTGIVVTDWVGAHGDWDLIRCIVGWNAKLQAKQ